MATHFIPLPYAIVVLMDALPVWDVVGAVEAGEGDAVVVVKLASRCLMHAHGVTKEATYCLASVALILAVS
jgi:predicted butyrate kinase (DUF1464 family)